MVLEGLEVHQVVVLSEDIAMTLEVADTRMVTTVALSRTHDVTLLYPRTCRRVAHGIAQSFRTAGTGKAQVVVTIALVEPRSFLIVLNSPIGFLAPRGTKINLSTILLDGAHNTVLGIKHMDVATGRDHILVKLDVIDIGIAPVHVSLTIIVDKHRGIDVLPVFALPHEGFAQGILERSVWRVSYQHANTMTMQRGIEIVLAMTLNSLDGPSTVLTRTPGEILQRSHSTVFGPVYHIGGRP